MRQHCPMCGGQDTSVIWSADKSQHENENSKMKTNLSFKIYWECNDCYFKWNKSGEHHE